VAASKSRVRVTGVREVQAAMKGLGAEVADLKAVHQAVSSVLVPGVRLRTPRRTGELAASWQAGATKTRARITTAKPYGGVIEYGHPARGIEPARMIGETVDASHAEILETYEAGLARLAAAEGFEVRT
jgi:hypothetical protein